MNSHSTHLTIFSISIVWMEIKIFMDAASGNEHNFYFLKKYKFLMALVERH